MEKGPRMDASIFEMVSRHSEVIDIMVEMGFKDVTKPGMLQTAGRFMTLSKGIKLKKWISTLCGQPFNVMVSISLNNDNKFSI